MNGPPFRGRISSHIFDTHNVTSTCRPSNLVWQTRQQRGKHDMARKVSQYEDFNTRGWEREEEKRRKAYDDVRNVRTSRYDGYGYSKYNDLREKIDSKKRKKRKDNNWISSRSRSCSRVRSDQLRGRSRSPRSPVEPGPSILKKRSQSAHGGRWGEDTIVARKTWKKFRISAVDEVLEYSPSSDVVDEGCVTEQEAEELVHKSDKDVTGRSPKSNMGINYTKKSQNSREKVSNKKKDAAVAKIKNLSTKECRSIRKLKAPAGKGSLNPETDGDNVSKDDILHLQSDHDITSVDITELTEVDTSGNTLLNAEVSLQNHEEAKVGVAESDDFNQNDLFGDEDFHGFHSEDINENYISEEEDFRGYDVTDLDFIDDNNIRVERLVNADDEKWDGELTIVFTGGYHTRQVPCQHKDCLVKSTPSIIGLLPFSSKNGHEWLCPDHTKCLLCSDPVDSTNSVMCVMCARVFHTTHLQDLGMEGEDMEELICKLCSDPEQFTPARNQSCLDSTGVQKSGIDKTKITKSSLTITNSVSQTKCKKTTRREIMTTDHSLPSGWSRQIITNSVNRKRVVITGPDARKYWSRRHLEKAFGDNKENVEWKSFSFSLYTSTKK